MTPHDIGHVLALIGSSYLTAGMLGARGGDAKRDVAVMVSAGGLLTAVAALLLLAG